jgi:Tol biopolymer transport system component/tRNA A-37 threonylcarbamoyl transferase component Bud32
MRLAAGQRLGPYEILGTLGAGGMGEVYRARDTRLGREVAIKVLPAERVADESRKRRFVQEAQAASALNHPNIVTIYEIESAEGFDFIVMELVAGKTLDTLIPRHGMRLGELLRVATPLSNALAAAHGAGIVHRDLKPANVMVTPEGVVKILDFGLAKLTQAEEASSEDGTTMDAQARLSRPGTVAGTPAYMSPEQTGGGEVDARSDVFSFGAVLYEMATGRRAFAGKSASETLAAVVRDQPKAPRELVPEIPEALERLIVRCLRKEPERRYHHMSDVKVELQEIKEDSDSAAVAPVRARSRRGIWVAATLAVLLPVIASVAWLLLRPAPAPPRVVQLTSMRGFEFFPAFSPSGDEVAFAWQGEKLDNFDIYLKRVDSQEVHRLTTDPAPEFAPSWSPDGRRIAFLRGSPMGPRIYEVSPLGGVPRKLSDFPARRFHPPSWSPDGRWLAVAREPLPEEQSKEDVYLLPVEGGEPRRLELPRDDGTPVLPSFSHDGRRLAYLSLTGIMAGSINVVDLGADLVPKGPPRQLTRTSAAPPAGQLAWARDGKSLVYAEFRLDFALSRVGIGGDRPPERVELAGRGAFLPATVASRDRLAFVRGLRNVDIYRFAPDRPSEPVVASSAVADFNADISPDGRRIVYEVAGETHSIWRADIDGTNAVQLTRGPGQIQGTPRWSPDGRRVAFNSQAADGHMDIWTIDAEGGAPRRLTQEPGDEVAPSWSRDGRHVYFSSTPPGGDTNVWRIPAEGGAVVRLTSGGGWWPHESLDGRTLYYMRSLARSPLLALPVAGGAERQLLDCVPGSGFAVGPAGIVHAACAAGAGPFSFGPSRSSLFVLDPLTGRDRLLGMVDWPPDWAAIAVSPDGQTILLTRGVWEGCDLMLIEGFR